MTEIKFTLKITPINTEEEPGSRNDLEDFCLVVDAILKDTLNVSLADIGLKLETSHEITGTKD
jgi:hypothetical protein